MQINHSYFSHNFSTFSILSSWYCIWSFEFLKCQACDYLLSKIIVLAIIISKTVTYSINCHCPSILKTNFVVGFILITNLSHAIYISQNLGLQLSLKHIFKMIVLLLHLTMIQIAIQMKSPVYLFQSYDFFIISTSIIR